MATLTNAQLTIYKRALRRRLRANPTQLANFRAHQLSKSAWTAVLQALEDGYDSRRLAIKGEMDTAGGVTLENGLAKIFEDIWMDERTSR